MMYTPMLKERMEQAIGRLHSDLVLLKGSSSHWTGALSTSALSTATAVSALSISRDQFKKDPGAFEQGLANDPASPLRINRICAIQPCISTGRKRRKPIRISQALACLLTLPDSCPGTNKKTSTRSSTRLNCIDGQAPLPSKHGSHPACV